MHTVNYVCRNTYHLQNIQTSSEAHPASCSLGTAGPLGLSSWGVKFDHSLPSNARVKNEWNYISAPPMPSLYEQELFFVYKHVQDTNGVNTNSLRPIRKISFVFCKF
jgi:hypothetical protein